MFVGFGYVGGDDVGAGDVGDLGGVFDDVHACDVGLDGDGFGDAGDLGIGEVGVIVVGVGGVCADDA